MQQTENRFKLKLPLAQNPLSQKLLDNILKITDQPLPIPQQPFKIGDEGKPLTVPGVPEHDKIVCKPRGSTDQGWCED